MDKKTVIKLNIIRLLCIISLIITALSIRDTYAKYYERVDTNYEINIKKWLVKVNNIDILEEEDYTQIINPIFETSEYANDDILVPGREGYFEVEVDYTNVDVSFEMNFTVEQITELEHELDDFEVFKIVEIDDEDVETDITCPIIVDIETAETMTRTFRIYFRWNDSTGSTMSDVDDTNYEGETETENDHTVVKYRASLAFSQYIIEEEGGE